MRRLLAVLLAVGLETPSFAQIVEVRLQVPASGMSMSGLASPLAPLRLSMSGPSVRLFAPSLQAPAPHAAPILAVVAVPSALPVVGYSDPGHWRPESVVDRDYARLLEEGAAKIEAGDVRPAALETLRAKDGKIYSHMMRVAIMAGAVALAMGHTPESARRTAWAARLHDLGKTEDAILAVVNKEGKLTPEEREVMMTHPQAGVDILFKQTDIPYDLHWPAMRAALSHHEAMDGSGYPQGLKGEDIPMEARITTVADYFDALLENRPYRAGMTIPEALAIMQKAKDKFDPQVWNAFLGVVHPQ